MFRIKNNDGGYFQKMLAIGPMFGGTKSEAHIFGDRMQAVRMLTSHFGFTMAEVEES